MAVGTEQRNLLPHAGIGFQLLWVLQDVVQALFDRAGGRGARAGLGHRRATDQGEHHAEGGVKGWGDVHVLKMLSTRPAGHLTPVNQPAESGAASHIAPVLTAHGEQRAGDLAQ
ncbi:hypothetical protein D3C72_2153780 [compost metagenome]